MSRSTGLAVSHRNQHYRCTCSQYAYQQVAAAASGAARSSTVYTQCQHKPADDAPAAPAEDTPVLCRIRAILRACISSACLICSLRSAVQAPHTAFSCTPACLSTASAVHRADSIELYRPGQKPGLTPFSSPLGSSTPSPCCLHRDSLSLAREAHVQGSHHACRVACSIAPGYPRQPMPKTPAQQHNPGASGITQAQLSQLALAHSCTGCRKPDPHLQPSVFISPATSLLPSQ